MTTLKALLIALIAVFAPLKAILLTTLVLIFVDLVTGVLAARKRGIPITSSGLKRTVGKIVLYEVAICVAFLAQTYMTGDSLPISKMVTALIGVVEMKSILENLDTVSGGGTFQALVAKLTQPQEPPK